MRRSGRASKPVSASGPASSTSSWPTSTGPGSSSTAGSSRPEVVYAYPGFLRPCVDLPVRRRLVTGAVDLARGARRDLAGAGRSGERPPGSGRHAQRPAGAGPTPSRPVPDPAGTAGRRLLRHAAVDPGRPRARAAGPGGSGGRQHAYRDPQPRACCRRLSRAHLSGPQPRLHAGVRPGPDRAVRAGDGPVGGRPGARRRGAAPRRRPLVRLARTPPQFGPGPARAHRGHPPGPRRAGQRPRNGLPRAARPRRLPACRESGAPRGRPPPPAGADLVVRRRGEPGRGPG